MTKGKKAKPSTIRGIISLILGVVSFALPLLNYFTGTLGIYLGLEQRKIKFTIPAKLGIVLNLLAMAFWTLIIVIGFLAFTPQAAVLDGATSFTGTFPATASVTYVTITGEVLTAEEAYPGYLYMYTDRKTPKSTIENLVIAEEGEIVSAIPNAGIYLIEVEPGQEAYFISSVYNEPWFFDAVPASPFVNGTVSVYDFYSFTTSSGKLDCKDDHGELVRLRAGRLGGSIEAVDLVTGIPHQGSQVTNIDIVQSMVKRMKKAKKDGDNVVFSLSIQPTSSNVLYKDRSGCTTASCNSIRHGQKVFFKHYIQMVDAQIAADPSIADRALFVIIAGNAGVDLDAELKELKDKYPKAFKHVKIVGATKDPGEISKVHNHLKNNDAQDIVYSLGEDVTIFDGNSAKAVCTGTSFAAPEVSAVLDHIWSKAPGLKATQVIESFNQALREQGKNNTIPENVIGTKQTFLDRAVAIAKAKLAGTVVPKTDDSGSPSVDITNKAPEVSVAVDQTVTLSGDSVEALVQYTVTDDGLPSGQTTSEWSKVSGPQFFSSESSDIITYFTLYETGIYTFKLTASDGELTGSDETTITVLLPTKKEKEPVDDGPTDEPGGTSVSTTIDSITCSVVDTIQSHRSVDYEFEITASGTASGPVTTDLEFNLQPILEENYLNIDNTPVVLTSSWTNSRTGTGATRQQGDPTSTSWTFSKGRAYASVGEFGIFPDGTPIYVAMSSLARYTIYSGNYDTDESGGKVARCL